MQDEYADVIFLKRISCIFFVASLDAFRVISSEIAWVIVAVPFLSFLYFREKRVNGRFVVSYSSHHFLHVQTAWSHADFADSRRQKTGWTN